MKNFALQKVCSSHEEFVFLWKNHFYDKVLFRRNKKVDFYKWKNKFVLLQTGEDRLRNKNTEEELVWMKHIGCLGIRFKENLALFYNSQIEWIGVIISDTFQ